MSATTSELAQGGSVGTAAMSRRVALAVVAIAAVIGAAHQLLFYDWHIEDAAISYAYARNFAHGEGLVPWPGGERIEGYSNPTWVLLLAGFSLVGVDGFLGAKLLAIGFGSLTFPAVWLLAREAMPAHRDGPAPLLAPIFLAFSAQFAIWNASGLENSLFCCLLAWGALRLIRESQEPSAKPWSAGLFLLLALTRPEGMAYAAVAWVWVAALALYHRRGVARPLVWAGLFGVPYAGVIALRLWYFAWPLPNTYYGKIGKVDQSNVSLRWYQRGWMQVRLFMEWHEYGWRVAPGGPGLGQGFFLPIYLAGINGLRGRRGLVTLAAVVLIYGSLAVPGPDWLKATDLWPDHLPEPYPWLVARIALLTLLAVGLPLLDWGRGGFGARGLAMHLLATALFFSVSANGDWMRGYRWFSMMQPSAAVLFAAGAAEFADFAQRRFYRWQASGVEFARDAAWGALGWLVALGALAAEIPFQVGHSLWFRANPEWSPFTILRRVTYTDAIADRLFLDHVTTLDMDMGAHLWWSDQEMVDMAGLVDIPLAHHTWQQQPFVKEYVFEEQNPDFAHVHGNWADTSRLKTYLEWSRYFELPRYNDGPDGWHDGVWLRKDHVLAAQYPGPQRRVRFLNDLRINGFTLPSREVGQGRALYFDLGVEVLPALAARAQRVDKVKIVAFVANADRVISWDVPLGYGWLPPSTWAESVFTGRFAMAIPADLPEGQYDFGFVELGGDGTVVPVAAAAPGSVVVPARDLATPDSPKPRFAWGEVRFPGAIQVVSGTAIVALAQADADAAIQLANTRTCDDAEERWTVAQRRLPRDTVWHATAGAPVVAALADCWAAVAEKLPRDAQITALARAHALDEWSPELKRVGGPVAASLWAEGAEARAAGDWERAYTAYSQLLQFQPWQAWARRYAEEARDHRLGLDAVGARK